MVEVLIWTVVLCGCETWTLPAEAIDRSQELEIWIWKELEKLES